MPPGQQGAWPCQTLACSCSAVWQTQAEPAAAAPAQLVPVKMLDEMQCQADRMKFLVALRMFLALQLLRATQVLLKTGLMMLAR